MSETPPAMCAGCGTPLGLPDLRIAAIDADGKVELQHDTDAGRCGPAIVQALRQRASEPRSPRRRTSAAWTAEVLDRVTYGALASAPAALTQREIAGAIVWPPGYRQNTKLPAVSASLRRLLERGVVSRAGRGVVNASTDSPFRYAITQRGAA